MQIVLEPRSHSHHQHQRPDLRQLQRRPRILIIEDDDDIGRAWSVLLDHLGYDVAVCNRGDEGLRRAQEGELDLILLDLGLPGMHGTKILHELRMARSDTPVVVVSAAAAAEHESRAMRSGAAHFLAKPVANTRLLETLDATLGG